MNLARICLLVWVCGLLAACNYDTGECWVKGEDGSGAGPIVTPIGAGGGFGDAPQEPLASDDWDPCSSGNSIECLVTWKSTCDSQATNCEPNTSIYGCACASNEEAKATCEKVLGVGTEFGPTSCGPCEWTEESRCRKKCAEKAEACEAECRKLPEDDKDARRKCWEGCNNARAECIRKCKK